MTFEYHTSWSAQPQTSGAVIRGIISTGGMMVCSGRQKYSEKPAPVPLCPTQLTHGFPSY